MKFVALNCLLFLLVILCVGCSAKKDGFVIGVSQCSDDEWRSQMNRELLREALFYPGTQVKIKTVKDDSRAQIKDIETFIRQKVDLLVVAPNEAEAITPVIEEAYQSGIPVVLVDRKIKSEKYTAYVGADNYEMGRQIGTYITSRLQGKGKIVELAGLRGSTPAVERHRGFLDALHKCPDIEIVASVDAGWFKDSAREAFDSILHCQPEIDLLFAHNDRMAAGAYEAALRQSRNQEILFIGVDALSGDNLGVELVANGVLDATFIYPTGGDKVMQVAMAILQGRPFHRENLMQSALVNHSNARIMEMQTAHIRTLDNKIEVLNGQLDTYLMRYSAQRMFLFACVIILVLVAVLLLFVVRAFWTKNRLNAELSRQKSQLEEQRDQLIDLSRKLEEATHAKLSFFTNISHDFRTPLTLIADPVDQLMTSKSLNDHERFLLNIIHKNVAVLLRLINQILDFRKFENGKLSMLLTRFDLAEGMQEWTEAFRTLAFRKHIHFTVSAEEGKDYTIVADAEKLERITYNLLSNAFKFTPENGVVSVNVSRVCEHGADCFCIRITDTGVGMPAEHVQHIFESFYQIDVHHAGSGIGLALVKAFVEMHHGSISVESGEKKGTSFTVLLPVCQAGEISESSVKNNVLQNLKEGAVLAADQETVALPETDVTLQQKTTVLIIDDNQDVRDYVKVLLQEEYTVLEAANGQEGVKLAMKYVPDVVICDVMMPVMDGMECCKRLKSEIQTSHIPVMMLTAYAMDEQKIKGYECGADSYISKPFSARLLKARLNNLIENHNRLKNFFADKTVIQKETLTDVDKGFIEKLRQLIDEHLSEPDLSVEDLGEKIGLGRVQLYRKTKALTGYSPNELLRTARLKKASALLASTEKTIAEVSYEVGFSSPSYFTKCYKDYFGESPTDFLKRKG